MPPCMPMTTSRPSGRQRRRRCGRGTSRPCCRGSRRRRAVGRVTTSHEVLVAVVDRRRRRRARGRSPASPALPAVATTRAPSACASWIANVPMPPAPPWTRKTSSGRSPAIMNTLDQTVQATSGRAAAVTRSTPVRHRHHLTGGHHDLRGVPAAGQQGAHLVTEAPLGRRPARSPRPCRCTPGRGRPRPRAAAGRTPCRCSRSARLTAVAATSTSDLAGAGHGVGQLARRRRTSGPPALGWSPRACVGSLVVERLAGVVDRAVVGHLVVDVVGIGRLRRTVPARRRGAGPWRPVPRWPRGRRHSRPRRSRAGTS